MAGGRAGGGSNFTPDGDGHNDSISFVPEAQYLEEGLDSWNFSIYDPKGNLFRSIKGKGALPQKIEWDGKSDRGETVLSKNNVRTVVNKAALIHM